MKKSKKSMAIAIAMIMACLPQNSLAAPKNNSSAGEDNSLASGKPESVGGAEQRSKEMSNSTKVSIVLTAGEIIWETVGYLFKIPTPGKGVVKAVNWMFLSPKCKLEKKVNKSITNIDELREAIKNFASTKRLDKGYEQITICKNFIGKVYSKYVNSNKKLFTDFHKDDNNREHNGFRVISSDKVYYDNNDKDKNDYCVYILKDNDECYKEVLSCWDQSPEWKRLCDAAKKLGQKIVVGCGIHDSIFFWGNKFSLEAWLCLGLESDLVNRIFEFKDYGSCKLFKCVLRRKGDNVNINNLEERLENKGNSKVYIVK